MTKNHVQNYVADQVRALSDRKIQPLVDSINGELAKQRDLNAQKAQLDTAIAASNERIAAFQKHIGAAQQEVNELATKLAEATSAAATTDRE